MTRRPLKTRSTREPTGLSVIQSVRWRNVRAHRGTTHVCSLPPCYRPILHSSLSQPEFPRKTGWPGMMRPPPRGSETQPAPAGSESGSDEEKAREGVRMWDTEKERREGGCAPTDLWKEVLNQPHVHTSSAPWQMTSQHKAPLRAPYSTVVAPETQTPQTWAGRTRPEPSLTLLSAIKHKNHRYSKECWTLTQLLYKFGRVGKLEIVDCLNRDKEARMYRKGSLHIERCMTASKKEIMRCKWLSSMERPFLS